eukprot:CAMPEP_0115136570 /NCGR_PEP_ID=MMETSP0227-20121206/56458_1 /TAXON_ID=89957 /ORGANISM="Polarella glacialis, Strain CCMP 1383" /LENGTH=56 /DNA_ID=CAMNT_0002543641 /DNA_START=88 /DNA_END=258 /DNA_ORIENTATION=-
MRTGSFRALSASSDSKGSEADWRSLGFGAGGLRGDGLEDPEGEGLEDDGHCELLVL